MSRIVIVGSQSAGFTAASFARLQSRDSEVLIVERRTHGLYHPCGIPLAIEGLVRLEDLVHDSTPPGVRMMCGAEAVGIDAGSRILTVRDVKSGAEEKVEYDRLILATGGSPVRPRIPGTDLHAVFTVRSLQDGEAIIETAGRVRRAAVVGGGAIGVEVSLSLRRRGLDVLLFEQMQHPLPGILDGDMAEIVTRKLEDAGVRVVCGGRVSEIKGEHSARAVVAGGEEYQAEMVVMAVGVVPEVGLARESGIRIGRTGGIRVDSGMRTSAKDIFAAGECAETVNAVTGEPAVSFLASTAALMGRVAGINAAGGRAEFPGVLSSTVVRADNIFVGSTGLTSSSAQQSGIDTVSARVRVSDRPPYVPGASAMTVKLIADSGSGRLVGGQVAGKSGVAETLDMLSFAIRKGCGPEELRDMEHCYMPCASDLISPLQVAADALLRKLR